MFYSVKKFEIFAVFGIETARLKFALKFRVNETFTCYPIYLFILVFKFLHRHLDVCEISNMHEGLEFAYLRCTVLFLNTKVMYFQDDTLKKLFLLQKSKFSRLTAIKYLLLLFFIIIFM